MITDILQTVFILALVLYSIRTHILYNKVLAEYKKDKSATDSKIESINGKIEKMVESKYKDITEYYENAILSLSKRIEKRDKI